MDLSGRSVKAQFKIADREQAAFCLIRGDSELAEKTILLKSLATGEQRSIQENQIISELRAMR
jgi:histidyl-tRNA synthetase